MSAPDLSKHDLLKKKLCFLIPEREQVVSKRTIRINLPLFLSMRPFQFAVLLTFVSLIFIGNVYALDVAVVGLFPGKAVLVIDSGAPKTYSVGNNIVDGIKLIDSDQSTATVEVNGKRQVITIGQHVSHGPSSGAANITLRANNQGHFVTQGQINGNTITMLVDTGATLIVLSAADARRMGIDYQKGPVGTANTANGLVQFYRVKLDKVRIGDIEINQVDASVLENNLPTALLGMSFLNRTEMHRNGDVMILTKRF